MVIGEGGAFRYVPGIRSGEDEGIEAIQSGGAAGACRRPARLNPGRDVGELWLRLQRRCLNDRSRSGTVGTVVGSRRSSWEAAPFAVCPSSTSDTNDLHSTGSSGADASRAPRRHLTGTSRTADAAVDCVGVITPARERATTTLVAPPRLLFGVSDPCRLPCARRRAPRPLARPPVWPPPAPRASPSPSASPGTVSASSFRRCARSSASPTRPPASWARAPTSAASSPCWSPRPSLPGSVRVPSSWAAHRSERWGWRWWPSRRRRPCSPSASPSRVHTVVRPFGGV